jgi:6,7-dimethyl-8-ribityllumazine synthase
MRELQASLLASDLHIALVAGRFNELIVDRLIDGAVDTFRQHGGHEQQLTLARVPGAFEIAIIAGKLAATGKFDAVVCLGAVIRGATSHYEHVCSAVTSGVAAVGHDTGVPTIFGLLTTDTIEQAIERAGTKAGNQGRYAMTAAIEMANLSRQIAKLGTGEWS